MIKVKKLLASIIIMLVFLCVCIPKSNANFFTDDWDNPNQKSDIEQSIDSEDGGIFEKIIAQIIGGIAETVFSITTNEELGVGFKEYDELIFAKDASFIAPFTDKQWDTIMKWYKIMSGVAGSLILIVVVIISYKLIIGSYSIEKRSEAKDSLLRLFFGAAAIVFAPIFVKLLLFLNNNLVHLLLGYANGSLNDVIGNKVLINIQTGNAIATAIVIAMFAYLFVKLNIKFIIRQFTILIFTLFTPIIAIMWMINKRTIGASIWFGQILINVFMQFIYAFLFLVYMQFLPQSGGWAVSLLWAMMILPLADALQNTLQNLISRIAGVDNEELSNRGIGMASAMAYSVKTMAYQFKNPELKRLKPSIIGESVDSKEIVPMKTNEMKTTNMNLNKINVNKNSNENTKATQSIINDNNKANSFGNVAINVGKEFVNLGRYMADGKNSFNDFNKYETIKSKKSLNNNENNKNNLITNMKDDDNL